MNTHLHRPNLLGNKAEAWRPPLFTPGRGPIGKLRDWVRRCLDLQAGSIWRDLQAILPHCRGQVLDVGCGAQPYRQLFSPDAHYAGIDTREARKHFGYDLPDTLLFDGDTWPIASASIDLALATETLEHVPGPARFLEEAYRCLKPGGRLVLTVPFAARWHFIPFDYWRFTPSGLEQLLSAAGFVNLAVHARGNELTVACYKIMSLILPLLFAPAAGNARGTLPCRLLGVILSPLLLLLALVANATLHGRGGNDCLGYTALAVRPAAERS